VPHEPASAEKSITVLAYRVEFSVDKNYVKPGDNLKLTVKTYADGAPVSRRIKVMIEIGTFTGTLFEGTTDATGTWTHTWTVPYRVTCPEGTVYLPCNKTSMYAMLAESPYTSSPRVDVYFMHPVQMTLTTDKDSYAPGEPVVATAKLEYRREDGKWAPIGSGYTVVFTLDGQSGSSKTDANGVATYTFRAPTASGKYTVKATFAGAGLAAVAVGVEEVAAMAAVAARPALLASSMAAPIAVGAALLIASLLR